MDVRELDSDLADVAKEELNEDPDNMKSDLKAMKKWISKQSHLHARTDDQWLIGFLRGCKYNLKKAQAKIDTYYTMRTAIPEISMAPDINESWVQDVLTLGVCVPLPNTVNPHDPRVIILRPGVINPRDIPISDVVRVIQIFASIQIMTDDQSVISGQRYIVDLADVNLLHVTQITSLARRMVMFGQDGLPFRHLGQHHINVPAKAEIISSFLKRFVNENNKSRIYIHDEDNMDDLYELVSKDILPQEYGGEAGPIQDMIDEWKEKVESFSDWITDDLQYKTDEFKRNVESIDPDLSHGIKGSFRLIDDN